MQCMNIEQIYKREALINFLREKKEKTRRREKRKVTLKVYNNDLLSQFNLEIIERETFFYC